MPTRNPPRDDAEQSARFLATAKELEAQKDGRAFVRALGVVVVPQALTAEPEQPKMTKPKVAKKKAAGTGGKTF